MRRGENAFRSGERTRLACWFWRLAKTNFSSAVNLLLSTVTLRRCKKFVAAETPRPALGTSALPRIRGSAA